jgi:hypothetical protein
MNIGTLCRVQGTVDGWQSIRALEDTVVKFEGDSIYMDESGLMRYIPTHYVIPLTHEEQLNYLIGR